MQVGQVGKLNDSAVEGGGWVGGEGRQEPSRHSGWSKPVSGTPGRLGKGAGMDQVHRDQPQA